MGEREKPVKVIREKRNWSAPGPDRMTHFWWKRARSLQEGVVKTGGTGMRSVEREYKSVKVKAAVNLYKNPDLTMETVRKFEERSVALGHQSLVKDAVKYAEELELS